MLCARSRLPKSPGRLRLTISISRWRALATVSPSILSYPDPSPPPPPSVLDGHLLSALDAQKNPTSLATIVKQYMMHSGKILDVSLPYESRPSECRRPRLTPTDSVTVLVAHCVRDGVKNKITLSSGFALEVPSILKDETLILTCAHTLEEIQHSPVFLPDSPAFSGLPGTATGSFCITYEQGEIGSAGAGMSIHPITGVASALPRSDLLLLSCRIDRLKCRLKTLPISPYPVHSDTPVKAHFVALAEPQSRGGWHPWIGGTWNQWVTGKISGYKDFAGRGTQPGTYDALSHVFFKPHPSPGSSGGPIIDEESGAVIGVILGSRMDSRVEGMKGWGVPSETIFEMFTLPGLEGKK